MLMWVKISQTESGANLPLFVYKCYFGWSTPMKKETNNAVLILLMA